jgi:ribosomal protein L21E
MILQNRKRLLLLLVFLLGDIFATSFTPGAAGLAYAQKPSPVVRVNPFENGEELLYVAEFSRALLKKVDVADFRFTAGRVMLEKKDPSTPGQKGAGAMFALKFTGDISSKGFFSKIFNLNFREQIESLVEPSSFTIQKTKKIDEQGKRSRTSEAVYDHSNGKVVWIERDPNNPSRSPRTASSSFTGQVQDVLSAVYYLRTRPLELGKTFELTIGDSGRVYQVPVRVVEKKVMKTVLGRVEALRVDAEVYGPDRMISGTGQFAIWFANDNRRIPVSARIKTEYGTFNVTLRKVIQNPTPREPLAQ